MYKLHHIASLRIFSDHEKGIIVSYLLLALHYCFLPNPVP
jgi:hypothetical protein